MINQKKESETSDDELIKFINENNHFFKLIDNPSEKVKLAALKINGYHIQYIQNPTEEMKIAAVCQFGFSISYIKDPSEEVQLAAIHNIINYELKDIYDIFIEEYITSERVKELYEKLKKVNGIIK